MNSAMLSTHVYNMLNLLFYIVMYHLELIHVHPSSYHLEKPLGMWVSECVHVMHSPIPYDIRPI